MPSVGPLELLVSLVIALIYVAPVGIVVLLVHRRKT
jgi:hypothetical protein